MKILQVVTYISPDGAYGGPVRVAVNQSKALAALGHNVVIAAAGGGFEDALPSEYDGYPVKLFPAKTLLPQVGFAGITSPGLFSWLIKEISSVDLVHIHLARDLVTLPAAIIGLLARKPVIVQTHGMIDRTDKWLARPLDFFLTRPVLRTSKKVLYLTNREHRDLNLVAGNKLELERLPNGVSLFHGETRKEKQPKCPEVLFLARMHRRKNPLLFVAAAISILDSGINADFRLVGPDEGEVAEVKQAIRNSDYADKIVYEGSLSPDQTIFRIANSDVYVLPSINEPFPMSVLEAMSTGRPVVITSTCGLSSDVTSKRAGIVCAPNKDSLAAALETLVLSEEARNEMGNNARDLIHSKYSITKVAQVLNRIYGNVVSS